MHGLAKRHPEQLRRLRSLPAVSPHRLQRSVVSLCRSVAVLGDTESHCAGVWVRSWSVVCVPSGGSVVLLLARVLCRCLRSSWLVVLFRFSLSLILVFLSPTENRVLKSPTVTV